jgi:hypothetical protein
MHCMYPSPRVTITLGASSTSRGRVVADLTVDSGQQGAHMFELCGFYGENEAFLTAVRPGIQPEADIRSAVQSVAVAEANLPPQEAFSA